MRFTLQALTIILLAVLTSGFCFAQSQAELDVIDHAVRESANSLEMLETDIANYEITSYHTSTRSGISHYYLRQVYKGVPIHNAVMGIHINAEGELLTMDNQFLNNIKSKINTEHPTLDARTAIMRVAQTMKYDLSELPSLEETKEANRAHQQIFTKGSISREEIPVQLIYQPMEDGTVRLCWDMSISETENSDWWSMRIDAQTGEILHKNNWTMYCNFGNVECGEEGHVHQQASEKNFDALLNQPDSYRVYPDPVESPNFGNRQLIVNPADALASPFGWHDTNGATGAEYTITRGNNVWAMEDNNGNDGTGFSPDGGASLDFDFALNLNTDPNIDPNRSAGITNLFYWNNLIHDVWYQYGFDEASGNYQENNYGRGGAGGDYVLADAQDGSGLNNANFSAPPDGNNGRIQMYLFSGNPMKDGSLSNGVVAHEAGHGISIRLVGGAANSNCLSNSEQMGEGWSDWFALIMTIEPTDTRTDLRSIGTFVVSQPATGNGIRSYPYTTDMAANPDVYTDISSGGSYPVGEVWCAMLWEMTWDLIDTYGFDSDLHNGTGGNNTAMALVIESLKLMPCGPGFIDARDALLQADQALYNGANQCLIRKAFARRGLGDNASQGSANSTTDATNDFVADCELTSCTGVDLNINFDGFPNQTSWDIIDDNANVVASGGNYSGLSPNSSTLENACLPDGCYTIQFYDSVNNGMCPFQSNAASSATFVTPGTLIIPGSVVATLGSVVTPGLCGNYSLTDADGTTLASGGGGFGALQTRDFCLSAGLAPRQIGANISITNNTPDAEMSVTPTLAHHTLTVNYSLKEAGNTQLLIIDITGKIIQQKTINTSAGWQEIQLDVTRLKSGCYFIQLINNDTIASKKFIKQ